MYEPGPLDGPVTGFRLVSAGDAVQASDHNLVMSQAGPIFASTAERDAAIPAPVSGMTCVTADTNTRWQFRSGAWALMRRPWTATPLTMASADWVADTPLALYDNGTNVRLDGIVHKTANFTNGPLVAAGGIPASLKSPTNLAFSILAYTSSGQPSALYVAGTIGNDASVLINAYGTGWASNVFLPISTSWPVP